MNRHADDGQDDGQDDETDAQCRQYPIEDGSTVSGKLDDAVDDQPPIIAIGLRTEDERARTKKECAKNDHRPLRPVVVLTAHRCPRPLTK
jgi:hypothetical protein